MLGLESIGKNLIIFGVILISIGVVLFAFGKIPWFGRLPGDVVIRKEGFVLYFPIVTMIIVSVVLTVIFNLIARR